MFQHLKGIFFWGGGTPILFNGVSGVFYQHLSWDWSKVRQSLAVYRVNLWVWVRATPFTVGVCTCSHCQLTSLTCRPPLWKANKVQSKEGWEESSRKKWDACETLSPATILSFLRNIQRVKLLIITPGILIFVVWRHGGSQATFKRSPVWGTQSHCQEIIILDVRMKDMV